LVVTAEGGPLPTDTRLNVRSGSNQEGEAYRLGQSARGLAVFCEEHTALPGAGGAGHVDDTEEGGAASVRDVDALQCRLYTQGPARLEITATGYQSIEDHALSFDKKPYCDVDVAIQLQRELPDAGK
jgi:hypothetical protein